MSSVQQAEYSNMDLGRRMVVVLGLAGEVDRVASDPLSELHASVVVVEHRSASPAFHMRLVVVVQVLVVVERTFPDTEVERVRRTEVVLAQHIELAFVAVHMQLDLAFPFPYLQLLAFQLLLQPWAYLDQRDPCSCPCSFPSVDAEEDDCTPVLLPLEHPYACH